jgi:hypothetical protein
MGGRMRSLKTDSFSEAKARFRYSSKPNLSPLQFSDRALNPFKTLVSSLKIASRSELQMESF